MDRREFLRNAGRAAAWAAIGISLSGCGSDDGDDGGPTGPGSQCAENGSVSTERGHTHSVCVTDAQLAAGNAVDLTLTGGGHTHGLQLSATEVAAIAEGTRVVSTSSTDGGHDHSVTFN
jgi:hypothetical protein